MKQSFFSSKILLFGEYGIIENSSGLSIPYNFYKGTLKFYSTKTSYYYKNSNIELKKYFKFLKKKI